MRLGEHPPATASSSAVVNSCTVRMRGRIERFNEGIGGGCLMNCEV